MKGIQADTKHTLAEDLSWLVDHIGSLKVILPEFVDATIQLSRKARGAMEKLIDQHGTNKVYDEDGELAEFSIPYEYRKRYEIIKKHHKEHVIFASTLPNMSLVGLISIYDAFLRKLLKNIYQIRPEILNGSSKQLTFANLMQFNSIEEAREEMIELEIDSLMRDSHSAQIEWIEKRIGVTLTGFPSWKHFIEITERRNLLVHADGVVSKQYLEICKKHNFDVPERIKCGVKIGVGKKYYGAACDFVVEICVKLTQVVWRKLLPQELKTAENSFIDTSFKLLQGKQYRLAELILQLSSSNKFETLNSESKMLMLINSAIACKGVRKNEECNKILDSIDFSSMANKFKLAGAVLREDYPTAVQLMHKIGDHDEEISEQEYREWPLFEWFRKTDEFKAAYEEIFLSPFLGDEKISFKDIFSDEDESAIVSTAEPGDADSGQSSTDASPAKPADPESSSDEEKA